MVWMFPEKMAESVLKIMVGQWSLTVERASVTAEKPCQTVTMTVIT